jgi:hypothetical protein
MDISDVARIIAQMTGMSKSSREEFVEFCEELEEKGVIDDLSDLDELDLDDLENLDDFSFIEDIDFGFRGEFDPGLGERRGKRSVEDYRERNDDDGGVDIHIPENPTTSSPYQDETWIELDNGYETFVDIPDNVTNANISISLEDGYVVVSDPVDEELKVSHLPDNISTISAEKKRKRILITVR